MPRVVLYRSGERFTTVVVSNTFRMSLEGNAPSAAASIREELSRGDYITEDSAREVALEVLRKYGAPKDQIEFEYH